METNFTIKLDQKVLRELRRIAKKESKTVSDLANEALRRVVRDLEGSKQPDHSSEPQR